jgi:predicted nucleic acid-binding protein
VSLYLDANVFIALLTPDPLTVRTDAFLEARREVFIVSDFAAAEYVSAISRRVRTAEISRADGQNALTALDGWLAQSARRVEVESRDVSLADSFLRRLDQPLLTPDAIHIAIAQRLDATLVTVDRQMAVSARALGAAVATP